jgi:hypothetical protein
MVYVAPIGSKHENESLFQNLVSDIAEVQTLGGIDALPSHGVKPTWGFHKVKLRKVETWRHAPDFQL